MGEVIRLVRGGEKRGPEGDPRGAAGAGTWLPPAADRRRILSAPGLAALGVLLLIGSALEENSCGKRAAALSHRLPLPLPWTMYALVYATLACGVAAIAVCALLFRTAARDGRRGVASWQGTLALSI